MSDTPSVPLEREALAILVQNPGARLCRELSEDDFTKPRNVIYSAAVALDSVGRLSEAFLLEQLSSAGHLTANGGITEEVREIYGSPEQPASLFPELVRELKTFTQRRHACRYASEIERIATDPSRPFTLPEPPRELRENSAPRFLEFLSPDQLADWNIPRDSI